MTQSTEQELYEQWREDYALADEPNYSVGTDFDCRSAFRAGLEAARRAPVVPQGWLPTAENINELPEPLRKYICDLETSCDPSGMVRHNTILRDQVAGLQAMYRKAADALAAAPQPPEAYSNSPEFDGIKQEAAPVQLPEPVAVMYHNSVQYSDPAWLGKVQDGTKLYTERQVHQHSAALEFQLDELAMLTRKLVQHLCKASPGNESAEKALDYLKRKGLAGNSLRAAQEQSHNHQIPTKDSK